jgi:hypothetical protein
LLIGVGPHAPNGPVAKALQSVQMKPNPAPSVPGDTEWQRFDNAVRNIFKVPETAILKERQRMEAERAKKKRAKKEK